MNMNNDNLIATANELSTVYQRITSKRELDSKCERVAAQVLDKISEAVSKITLE